MLTATANKPLTFNPDLKGKKLTIAKFSEMGFLHSIQATIADIFIGNYAQYRDIVIIHYIPNGKRTTYVWRICGYETYAVWEGFVNPDTEMFRSSETDSNGTKISRSLLSFSPEYLHIALNSVDQEPIYLNTKS